MSSFKWLAYQKTKCLHSTVFLEVFKNYFVNLSNLLCCFQEWGPVTGPMMAQSFISSGSTIINGYEISSFLLVHLWIIKVAIFEE